MIKSPGDKFVKNDKGIVMNTDDSYYHFILTTRKTDELNRELEEKLARVDRILEELAKTNG